MSGLAAVPAIAVLCYCGAEVYKALAPPAQHRHIPALCGMLGVGLGILCFFLAPGLLPAGDVFTAAALGAVSGWAATGCNQTIKQEREEE